MIGKVFGAVNKLDSQWLAALTLSAFVAMLVLLVVLSAATAPLVERTGTALVNLQLSGAHPLFSWFSKGKTPTKQLLQQWMDNNLIESARRSQRIDFGFAFSYGALWLLLAVATWRSQPEYPEGARWVRWIALGAVAAVFDECENVLLWAVLMHPADPGILMPAMASVFAVAKMILLAVAPIILLFALRRARA